MRRGYALARLALRLAVGGALARRRPADLKARLAAFPQRGLPVQDPVRIYWNDHQVPFIEAQDDRDAAVALGLVHAHLRLAQMEMMRRIAYGRLSEVVGAVAVDLDHTLRLLDFPAAVPDCLAMMPPDARAWCAGFVDGVNAAIAETGPLAPSAAEEFRLFGIRPAPWRVEDVLAVGRLAAADFSWRVWHRLFALRDRPDWPDVWQRILQADQAPAPVPQLAGSSSGTAWLLHQVWAGLGRSGSNAVAVAGTRSTTGHALLSSDPHLPIMTPSNWLAVGLSSPGYHIVGLMIPGLPVVGLGRNRRIAWSGTNLHAASSDLFDVTGAPDSAFETRRERIRIRWGSDREVALRRTAHGPVITDSPLLRGMAGRDLAMAWIGHRPSDELSAMLGMMRAGTWQEFTDAAAGFAAPAQNLIFADADGRVGQCMAAHLPARSADLPADLVLPADLQGGWERIVTGRELPMRYDPEEGFVASANDRPPGPMAVPVGFFFSPDERVGRLRQVLGGDGLVGLEELRALHEDVRMPSSLRMRDLLLDAAGAPGQEGTEAPLLAALRGWDGGHDAASEGALAFELLLAHLVHQLHGAQDAAIYRAMHQPWSLLREDFTLLPRERVAAATRAAARAAAPAFLQHRHWGAIHRIRVQHPLAALPVLGGRYRVAEFGAGGSNETLMKTAHGFSEGPHAVTFGANARFLTDLGDEDATWFTLLGGQDGWLGSSTFADQIDLWRRRDYARMPLRLETVRAEFRHMTLLQPARVAAEQAAQDRRPEGAQ